LAGPSIKRLAIIPSGRIASTQAGFDTTAQYKAWRVSIEDPDKETKADWLLSVLGVLAGPEEPAAHADEAPPPDGDDYRTYLLKKLKLVKAAGQGNFGLALGKAGLEHRMAVDPRAGARALAARVARTSGLRPVTWGSVTPDPDRPAILRVAIEGRVLPGLCKQGNRMLRAFKPLPFARMVLWADGKEITAPDDGTDNAIDGPVSVLPEPAGVSTPQSRALQSAALHHAALCEECPVR
jgi:hypothetical protein